MRELLNYLLSMPYTFAGIIFYLGACVGSFLNVCIYRLPDENQSIVKPSSFCPSCKKSIRWYDNVPLLSYIILRGKCRNCSEKISIRYFLVELVTALSFLVFFEYFGLSVRTFFLLYLFCSLLVATVIDFKLKIIPDEVTFYGILIGLVWSFLSPEVQFEIDPRLAIADSILGVLVGGGVIYLVAVIGDFLFKKESMGGGDIKLLAMIGAFLGWKMAILTFLLSPYFAIFFALYSKFYKKESVIPFGPFLSGACLVSLFFGHQILGFLGY